MYCDVSELKNWYVTAQWGFTANLCRLKYFSSLNLLIQGTVFIYCTNFFIDFLFFQLLFNFLNNFYTNISLYVLFLFIQ
jgi:hypothetical protein